MRRISPGSVFKVYKIYDDMGWVWRIEDGEYYSLDQARERAILLEAVHQCRAEIVDSTGTVRDSIGRSHYRSPINFYRSPIRNDCDTKLNWKKVGF